VLWTAAAQHRNRSTRCVCGSTAPGKRWWRGAGAEDAANPGAISAIRPIASNWSGASGRGIDGTAVTEAFWDGEAVPTRNREVLVRGRRTRVVRWCRSVRLEESFG